MTLQPKMAYNSQKPVIHVHSMVITSTAINPAYTRPPNATCLVGVFGIWIICPRAPMRPVARRITSSFCGGWEGSSIAHFHYTYFHCQNSILHPLPLPNFHSTTFAVPRVRLVPRPTPGSGNEPNGRMRFVCIASCHRLTAILSELG